MLVLPCDCCTPTGCDCAPCDIPKAGVTLTWPGGAFAGTMAWQDPDCFWLVYVGGPFSGVSFGLFCTGVGTTLNWTNFDDSESMGADPAVSTCSPLHLVFHSTLAGPQDFYVDYP